MFNLIRNYFYLFNKHYKKMKVNFTSWTKVYLYSRTIKHNKKKLELYSEWPIVDVRNKAKVMYDKRLAYKLIYELKDEMKKEIKNAKL